MVKKLTKINIKKNICNLCTLYKLIFKYLLFINNFVCKLQIYVMSCKAQKGELFCITDKKEPELRDLLTMKNSYTVNCPKFFVDLTKPYY